MNFLKPNVKTAIIITIFIFAQKIYRHPSDFYFIFNEGFFVALMGILGGVMFFGSVCAFVFLGLVFLNQIIEKIKK